MASSKTTISKFRLLFIKYRLNKNKLDWHFERAMTKNWTETSPSGTSDSCTGAQLERGHILSIAGVTLASRRAVVLPDLYILHQNRLVPASVKWKSTKKTWLGKQLRQWAWMAVSQASQTPGLGPNSSPPVGRERPTATEVVVGQGHLRLNTKIFRYGWMLVLLKVSPSSQEMDVMKLWDLEGGSGSRFGTGCQLFPLLRVLHPNSNGQLCSCWVPARKTRLSFSLLSTSCWHLLSAHWSGVCCTSPPGGHLPITQHREVWDTALMKYELL